MRKIESPVERWPGYIGIPSPMTYPQLIQVADMLDQIDEIREQYAGKKSVGLRINAALIPGLFSLVEEWGIEGIENDPDQFPAEPLEDSDAFLDWWYLGVLNISKEEKSKNE